MEDGYDTHLMFGRAYKVFFHNCCVWEFVNKVVKHFTHKNGLYMYVKVQVCLQWSFQQNINAVIMILNWKRTLVLKISLIWDLSFLTVGDCEDVCLTGYDALYSHKNSHLPWWRRQQEPLKHQYTSTWLHNVTSWKTATLMCATYVLMLHDFNFSYCISHFSSWKMLPKIMCIWRCGMLW
jgi:hypothetical protein